jgi:predicted RNA-binding Zn ribbon-like protein
MAARPLRIDGFIAAPREDLCLDFVNTRSWRGRETPTEELHRIDDVLGWASSAGGVDEAIIGALRSRWAARPREAEAALASAIALRETLFRLFAAVSSAEAADPADLDALNAALASGAARSRMAARDGRFVWWSQALPADAAGLLSPVLWSAADLLAGSRRPRVRQCANPECRWMFLDDSKSGNRRWCSMASCGNRAKAHRHYLKAKASRTGETG